MSATLIPPPPPAAPDVPRPTAAPEPPVHLLRLLLALALGVAMFDLCFWKVNGFGFSVAIFFAALEGIILASRPGLSWTPLRVALSLLFLGACFAAVLETGVTNTFTLLALAIVLAGDTYFDRVESPWGRWLSQGVALLRAPGRIFWLTGHLIGSATRDGAGWVRNVLSVSVLALPALVLALVFGGLLAMGNAVFGSWANSFFTWFFNELAAYLDPGRIFLWAVVAVVLLPLLRPVAVSELWWSWTHRLPRFPEIIPHRGMIFSSALVLLVLNALFLVANIADALFLWGSRPPPGGDEYKVYVHQGVEWLIATVILTAIVLTAIFQQPLAVARRRELKALALLWIAQNVFLNFSVALRIKYYIVTYELTVLRLGVIIFLLLVATGFALLTIKILWKKSLSWLIGGCLLAIFATFYITQFLDLEGWSANYNVARFQRERSYHLDFQHLYEYGPQAWPALRLAHVLDPSVAILNDRCDRGPLTTNSPALAQFDSQHWREFSLRAWFNRRALDEAK